MDYEDCEDHEDYEDFEDYEDYLSAVVRGIGSPTAMTAAEEAARAARENQRQKATNDYHIALCRTWCQYAICSVILWLLGGLVGFACVQKVYVLQDWLRFGAVTILAFLSHRCVTFYLYKTIKDHAWVKHTTLLVISALLMLACFVYLLVELTNKDTGYSVQWSWLCDGHYAKFFSSTLCASGLVLLGLIFQNDVTFGSVCFLLVLLELTLAAQPAAVCVILMQHCVFNFGAGSLEEVTAKIEELNLPHRAKGEKEPLRVYYDTSHAKEEPIYGVVADFFIFVFLSTVELAFAIFYLEFFENHKTLFFCSVVPHFLEHCRTAFMYDADAVHVGTRKVNGLLRFILLCMLTALALHALEEAAKGGYDWMREITAYDSNDSESTNKKTLQEMQKKIAKDRTNFWNPLHEFKREHSDKIRDLVVIACVSWRLVTTLVTCIKYFILNMQDDGDKYETNAKSWTCLIQTRLSFSIQSHSVKIIEYFMCFVMFAFLPDAYVCSVVLYTIIMGLIFAIQVDQFGKDIHRHLGNADASPVKCKDADNASTADDQKHSKVVQGMISFVILGLEAISLNVIPICIALSFMLMHNVTAKAAVLVMLALPLSGTVLLFEIFGSMQESFTCAIMVHLTEQCYVLRWMETSLVEQFRRTCPQNVDARGRATATKRIGVGGGARDKSPGVIAGSKAFQAMVKNAITGLNTIPAQAEYFSGIHCDWQTVTFVDNNQTRRVPSVRKTDGTGSAGSEKYWDLVGIYSPWQQMLLYQIAVVKWGLIPGKQAQSKSLKSVMLAKVDTNERLKKAVEAMPAELFKDGKASRNEAMVDKILELEAWISTTAFEIFFESLDNNPPKYEDAEELYVMCVWPSDSELDMPIIPHADIVNKMVALKDRKVREHAAAAAEAAIDADA